MLEALLCMSLNIYFEARSESVHGQIAVAEVTLNRVQSNEYPDSICGVVLQENKDGCQFSWWCDGRSDKPKEKHSFKRAKAIAKLMIEQGDYISVVGKEATHYHTEDVTPYWSDNYIHVVQIGKHIFYKKENHPLLRPHNLIELIQGEHNE
jgi:spore germination cell wall hydrolase CwlJ-like protein